MMGEAGGSISELGSGCADRVYTARPYLSDDDLQHRADKLQEAAEKASGHVRNLQLTLLSFGAYLAIVFGSTTHEQLLRGTPVKLPLLGVELWLVGFYWVAPFLFVLLHFNLLVQAHLLRDKVAHLHDDVFKYYVWRSKFDIIERARLDSFPLTQMLTGDIQIFLSAD
jgi:hypothetical protein